MVGREEEDYPDEMEERLVNEEYKIWKKNTPFLYGNAVGSPDHCGLGWLMIDRAPALMCRPCHHPRVGVAQLDGAVAAGKLLTQLHSHKDAG